MPQQAASSQLPFIPKLDESAHRHWDGSRHLKVLKHTQVDEELCIIPRGETARY